MIPTTTSRIALTCLVALGAAAVRAQEMPPAAQELTLVYKYQTGNLQKFKMEATSDLSITPEGGGFGPLPVSSKITTVYTEKVTGTRSGTGTISAKVESFVMNSNALGNQLGGRLVNGKLKYTMNGQPAPEGGLGAALSGAPDMSKPISLKRDPRGAITDGGAQNLGGAGPGNTLAQFPDHPVKVGDTWETMQPLGAGIANGPVGGSGASNLQAKFTHTLKELVVKNGRTFALIESLGASTPAEEQAGAPTIKSIAGITRFDMERGVVVSGKYQLDLSMKIGAPGLPAGGAAGGADAAAPTMKVDGISTLVLTEVPATPAKAPAKKPVKAKAKSKARRR